MPQHARPGAGPLQTRIPYQPDACCGGGFQALESWLYDHDYVDLDRRRASFLAGKPVGVRAEPTPRRLLAHTQRGVPGLIRDVGRRQIVVSCEYRRVRDTRADA